MGMLERIPLVGFGYLVVLARASSAFESKAASNVKLPDLVESLMHAQSNSSTVLQHAEHMMHAGTNERLKRTQLIEHFVDFMQAATAKISINIKWHSSNIVVLVGAVACMAMGFFACWKLQGSRVHATVVLRTNLFVAQFVMCVSFSILIVDSYDLSLALHMDAAYSGLMIGIYSSAAIIGGLAVWGLTMYVAGFWWKFGRVVVMFGIGCNILYAYLYLVVVNSTSRSADSKLAFLLIMARMIGGIGSGAIAQLTSTTVSRVTMMEERPVQMTNLMTSNMIGIALGPVMSVAIQQWIPTQSSVAYLNLMLLFTLSGSMLRFPFGADKMSVDSGELQSRLLDASEQDVGLCMPRSCLGKGAAASISRKRIVLAGALLAGLLRASVVSAMEVGTALLLQVDFGYAKSVIGILIGAAPLMSIPLNVLYKMYGGQQRILLWIRVLNAMAFVGVLLVRVSDLFGGWTIILGDVLGFSSIYIAEALILGVMLQNTLPQGSMFADENTAMLYRMLLSNGAGRLLGPWLARWTLQLGGLACYFYFQAASVCGLIAVFETMVKPFHQWKL